MKGLSDFTFAIVIALFCGVTCGDDEQKLTEEDLLQFSSISKAINHASKFTLYEGLPHQHWEGALLKQELATKKTFKIHGFPFYERPLPIEQDDIEPLRRLSADESSYSSFREAKLCGGFHPDYCLKWTDEGVDYFLLICLGCQEMQICGPEQKLLVDLRPDAFELFEARVTKYRDQRPTRE